MKNSFGNEWWWWLHNTVDVHNARNWTLKNGHSGKFFVVYPLPQFLKIFFKKRNNIRESETQKFPIDFLI